MGKTLKLKDVGPEIEKRLNKFIDGYVTGLQKQLAEAAPYKTGRLASSWRIGQGSPNRDVEPERETPGGVTVTDFPGEITFGPDYYVSSNIEYAERLALYRISLHWLSGNRQFVPGLGRSGLGAPSAHDGFRYRALIARSTTISTHCAVVPKTSPV